MSLPIVTIMLVALTIWQLIKPIYSKKGMIVITVMTGLYWIYTAINAGLKIRSTMSLEHTETMSDEEKQAISEQLMTYITYSMIEMFVLAVVAILLFVIIKKKKYKIVEKK